MHIQRQALGEAGRIWMLTIVHHPDRARIGLARPLPRSGRAVLGRGATTALPRVLDADGVSREHAAIAREGGDLVVTDLESKNGTWVDGDRVTRAALRDGAVLQLGAILLRVHRGRPRLTRGGGDDLGLLGISDAMATLRKEIATVAPHPTSVMVVGETGVGKELVARALHDRSGRRGDLVSVNCGALTEELLASALFGHVRGAFTGAVQDRRGLIEAAARGTLVLDELADASPRMQAALLRVLEENTFRPVGATSTRAADVRWVAAAQPAIEARVADGDFRLDLWTRLARWVLTVPPLRERSEDVPLLAAAFAAALRPGATVTPELALALMRRPWRGNVRELKSVVERLVVSADGATVLHPQPWLASSVPPAAVESASDQGPAEVAPAPSAPRRRAPQAPPSRAELVALLETHDGNLRRIADTIDVGRRTLYRWLAAHDLDPASFRG